MSLSCGVEMLSISLGHQKCNHRVLERDEKLEVFAIYPGELLKLYIINAPFAEFTLGYVRVGLAQPLCDLYLCESRFFASLYKSLYKLLVRPTIYVIPRIHALRYSRYLTHSPKWGILFPTDLGSKISR